MSDKSQNYISRVHFKGYKSIKDLEIDLKPGLNIIIGPNGSGKTNFLEFLFKTRSEHPFESSVFSSVETQITDIGQVVFEWIVEEALNSDVKFIYTKRESINGEQSFIRKWRVFADKNKTEPPFEQSGDWINPPFGNAPTIISFGIDESFIKAVADSGKVIFDLKSDGKIGLLNQWERKKLPFLFDGVFGTLNDKNIYNKPVDEPIIEKIDFSAFNRILKTYSPVDAIRFEPGRVIQYLEPGITPQKIVLENLVLQFFIGGKWLYWNQLSDGTQRMFYVITQVATAYQYVLLEEPELGIHPDQLYKIMDFLKEQSKEKQIIITTHSPEALTILNKDELDKIIVTHYDPELGTQMHHLSESHIEKAKIYMEDTGGLSDFWVHSNLEEYEAAE